MYYNTGNLVSYIYNTGCTSNVHLQYWNTRIVDLFTIPEAPVFFIQQYCKIYIPCNFEVNPITHLGVIALFSSNFQNVNTFHPLFQKL